MSSREWRGRSTTLVTSLRWPRLARELLPSRLRALVHQLGRLGVGADAVGGGPARPTRWRGWKPSSQKRAIGWERTGRQDDDARSPVQRPAELEKTRLSRPAAADALMVPSQMAR